MVYAYVTELDRYYHERVAEGMRMVPAGVSASSEVVSGDPAAVLAEQSRDLDLFVIGSRGYGPVRRVFLGGVAHDVVKAAACPVTMPRSAEHTSNGSESLTQAGAAAA